MRGDTLHLLTHDHTLVGELVRRGALSPEEAQRHRLRSVIVNAVGGSEAGAEVEAHKLDVQADDVLLLCSDGLTGNGGGQEDCRRASPGKRSTQGVRTARRRGEQARWKGQHHRDRGETGAACGLARVPSRRRRIAHPRYTTGVLPGTAAGGTGTLMSHDSLAGIVSSLELSTWSHFTTLPV